MANQAAAKIIGMPAAKISGLCLSDPRLGGVLENGTPIPAAWDPGNPASLKRKKDGVMVRFKQRGGKERWARVSFLPQKGSPLTVLEDVSATVQVRHKLDERAKELKAFYALSEIMETSQGDLNQLYQQVIDTLPKSWQYPRIACGRIRLYEKSYQTKNFKQTEWKLAAPIRSHGAKIGAIEIYYLAARPDEDEGPFLHEERKLLNAFAERIGKIAEREVISGELRRMNSQYKLISEHAFDVIWVMDVESQRFVYISPSIENLLGFTQQEAMQKSMNEILTPDSFEKAAALLAQYLPDFLEGKPLEYIPVELEQYNKKGVRVPVEITTTLAYGEEGKIHLIGITRNISERIEAQAEKLVTEKRLLASERRNKIIADAIPDLVFRVSREGVYLDYNLRSREALYMPPERFIGRNLHQVLPEEVATQSMQAIERAFKENKPQTYEYSLTMAGQLTEFEGRVVANQSENEAIVIIRNVTERKQAEATLRETNEYLDNLFNYANAPIIVWDANFAITRFNHAFEKLTGRTESDVLGRPLEILFPKNLVQPSMDLIRKTLSGERWEVVEIPILHVDGTVRTVLWNSATLFSADGKTPIATIAQGQDITERELAKRMIEFRLHLIEYAANHSLLDLLQFTLDKVCEATDSPIGFYHFVEPDQKTISLQAWSTRTVQEYCKAEGYGLHYPLEQAGVWADSLRLRQPIVHNDYSSVEHKKGLPEGHAPLIRELVVPILRDDKVVAILGVGNCPQDYLEKDMEIVAYYADVAWEVAERKKAEAAMRLRLTELETINTLSKSLRAGSNLHELLSILMAETMQISQASESCILLLDSNEDQLELVQGSAWFQPKLGLRIEREKCIATQVLKNSQAYTVPDFSQDPLLSKAMPGFFPPESGGVLLPIRGDGEDIGVFMVLFPAPHRSEENELHLLTIIAEFGANAIARSRLHDQVKESNLSLQSEVRQKVLTQELLAAEKELLSTTLMSIAEGVIITDNARNILLYNRVAAALTGYPPQEAIGQPLSNLLKLADPHTQEIVKDPISFLFHMEELSRKASDYKPPMLKTKSGAVLLVSGSIAELQGSGGSSMGHVIVFQNITEKHRAESQVMLSQKMEAIGQLAAGIAHEINTPIQYIGDNLRYLQKAIARLTEARETYQAEDLQSWEEVKPRVDEIEQKFKVAAYLEESPVAIQESLDGVERVRKIVLAMREFSHPSEKEKKPADINHGIETTIVISRNEWKYVADLETDLDPTLPLVTCQIDEINQVVLNMIVNAAQAIQEKLPKGSGEKGMITIRTRRAEKHAQIIIEDTGRGVPEELRTRIFDPFFTTKGVGKGTGQGLSMAHNIIVNKHQGQIKLDSVVGEGAIFTIELPLDESESEGL